MRQIFVRVGMAVMALGLGASLPSEAKADAVDVRYCFYNTCANPGNVVEALIIEVVSQEHLVIEVKAVHILDADLYEVPEVGQRYSIDVRPGTYEANSALVLLSPKQQNLDQGLSEAWRTFKAPVPDSLSCWNGPNYAVLIDDFIDEVTSADCNYLNLPVAGEVPGKGDSSGCQGGANPMGFLGLGLALALIERQRRKHG